MVFLFRLLKRGEKEKRKKNKTSPLFPLLLQAFFFFAKEDVREKIWHVKRGGEDQKEKKKKKIRDMIGTRKAGPRPFSHGPFTGRWKID